jgi:hypothetical protein
MASLHDAKRSSRCTNSTIVIWVAPTIYLRRCTKMASAGTTPFYGREHELQRLQELAGKKTASLVIIKGRRRRRRAGTDWCARRAGPGGNRIIGSQHRAAPRSLPLRVRSDYARATMTAKGGRCLEFLEAVRLFLGEAIRLSEAGGLLARRRMSASMTS